MRSSDWSSDVCSSDLCILSGLASTIENCPEHHGCFSEVFTNQFLCIGVLGPTLKLQAFLDEVCDPPAQRLILQRLTINLRRMHLWEHLLHVTQDRKRVVKGQRVSLRVDLVGRR